MQFPENGVKIPEEQKEILFKWDEFTQGMQPYYNYRFYFRVSGQGVNIEKNLLKSNNVVIPIKDLAGSFGLSEGAQYNWEVRAVQHVEGDDRNYYNLVNNPAAQYGSRVQVVSQNSSFVIVPAVSRTVVPFAVEPESPLYGLEPIKASDRPENKISPEEKSGSVIPTAVTQGTQPKAGTTVSLPEPVKTENNYTPIVIGVAALIALYFFID